jgi:hypothetical protein
MVASVLGIVGCVVGITVGLVMVSVGAALLVQPQPVNIAAIRNRARAAAMNFFMDDSSCLI